MQSSKTLSAVLPALVILTIGSIFSAAARAQAGAESYPDKPVRIIVPFAPGGSTDLVGRTLAQKMSESWNQTVVVENRGGGATIIGTEAAVKSKPDGYTLLIGVSTLATNPAMQPKLPYEAMHDLEPISMLARAPIVAYINPSFAPQDLKGLIVFAKSTAGGVHYGSGGTGTVTHLAAELLRDRTGAPLTHIVYKGGTPAMADAIAGHIPMTFATVGQALQHYRAKQLRALGVTSAERYPSIPDVPTFKEQGFDIITSEWFALFAPAGTPKPIIDKLNTEVRKIVTLPNLADRLTAIELISSSPQELADFVRRETHQWGELIRKAGLKEN
ncbi:MAG: tripartite tricarboxylate transporter substrate binding protein [Betaproteobacteria bacterium]|nr:tripartite tricarboxylate transporter substrate binding protein [Betaproteobacteria bacterium]